MTDFHAHRSTLPAEDLLVHADFLRALARRLVVDDAEADDLVQEVWMRSLHRPPAHGDSLKAWLARVARNLVSDRRRSDLARKRREALAETRTSSSAESHDDLAQRLAVLDELGRAFGALPENYREVLYLRYYADRTPDEIARRLERPLATVKTQLRRGLELLRTDMEGRTGGRGELRALILPLCVGFELTGTKPTAVLWTGALLMKKAIVAVAVALVAVGSYVLLDSDSSLDPEVALDTPDTPRGGEVIAGATDEGPATPRLISRPQKTEHRSPVDSTSQRATLLGTVLYSDTRQGAPYYTFEVVAEGQSEWMTTDAEGHFASKEHFPEQITARLKHSQSAPAVSSALNPSSKTEALRSFEDPTSAVLPATPAGVDDWIIEIDPISASRSFSYAVVVEEVIRQRALDNTCNFAVQLGPTFFVDTVYPPNYGPGDFTAIYGPSASPLDDDSLPRRARLQDTPRDWVRFPRSDALSSEQVIWNLRLESASGLWAGDAQVPFILGVCESPVRVELNEFGTLSGTVNGAGTQLPSDLWIQLQSDELQCDESVEPDENGQYEFKWLEAGTYTLFVNHTDYYPFESAQRVEAGKHATADITLDARPPGGSLSGRITSSTGQFQGRVVLFLEGLDDQDVWRRADPRWVEEDGAFVADYRFDELGSGSYSVTCCTVDAVHVEDRVRVLSPPNESADFHVDDGRAVAKLVLHPIDKATGELLADYQVYFHPAGNVEAQESGSAAEPWTREVSEGVAFRWRVHAPGYRAASGNESAFSGDAELTVALEPGFSAVINLNSIESLRSLEGVEVFADGVSVGWTDADGFLYLDLPSRPTRISLDPTLWTVYTDGTYRSDFDVETGFAEWDENEVFLSAYLRPVR